MTKKNIERCTFFHSEELRYWEKGLLVLPRQWGRELSMVKNEASASRPSDKVDEQESDYDDTSVSLVLGTDLTPEFKLGAIHTRNDDLALALAHILGRPDCVMESEETVTIFIRVPKGYGQKSASFGEVDILVEGRQILIPPSLDPSPNCNWEFYRGVQGLNWCKSLLDISFDDLPVLRPRIYEAIRLISELNAVSDIINDQATDKEGASIAAGFVRIGCSDFEIFWLLKTLIPQLHDMRPRESLLSFLSCCEC
jgi:hypothetical protein